MYFDESFQLENAAKSFQVIPDTSDLGIEGLSLSGQGLLGQKLNISLSIHTNPVDFTAALRFVYQNGFYEPHSGVFIADIPGDPFSTKATLGFRGASRVVKLEAGLDF